eukprot:scaffold859_cov132-Isochrysis_galbana.AAC.1
MVCALVLAVAHLLYGVTLAYTPPYVSYIPAGALKYHVRHHPHPNAQIGSIWYTTPAPIACCQQCNEAEVECRE